MRKYLTPKVKTAIALDALKGQLTWTQISSKHKISAPKISEFKKCAEQSILRGFSEKSDKALAAAEEKNQELLRMLGEAQLEIAWLKKKSSQFTE